MTEYARRMMALFGGYRGAHGTHGAMHRNPEKNGKLEIKKTARTLREPVTEDLWDQHLAGKYYLGIIPVDEEGMSSFGAIDVDRYDINLGEVATMLRKRSLPMVVCRSKSGGAHVYLFLSHPIPAARLRAYLRQVAANCGWGESEIYPKQNMILADRGDLGNWLNMPYQDYKKPERYAVRETMAAMSLGEFLDLAEASRVDLDEDSPEAHIKQPEDESLDDGPPCLQHLCAVGFPPGQGNDGFVALATFCKKKYGSRWKEVLEQYNRQFFNPPRPADEVTSVTKRLENKDYNYRCKNQPIVSYCNATLCRTRKYGVGGGGHYPSISGLSKLETEPVLWFMDIGDARLELETRQLQNYREFQAVCMDKLTTTFMPMKMETWTAMVGEAMDNAIVIEAPPETTIQGTFVEYLQDFCTDRLKAERPEDLLSGRPWFDEEEQMYYFRLRDLMAYLNREKFVVWGRNKVGQRLLDLGGEKKFINIKGHGVNTYAVPTSVVSPSPQPSLPMSRKDPI